GPIPNGSFLVTGRKSYYGRIFKNFLNGKDSPFDFWDVTYKAHYADPENESLGKFTVHGFFSGDEVNNRDPLQEDYAVRNAIGGVSWQKVWASPLYSTVSLSYSGSSAETRPNFTSSHPRSNKVDDITADVDFAYVYDSKDELVFGMQNKFLKTNLQVQNPYGRRISFDEHGWDMNIYADYQYKRWDLFRLNLGVRAKLSGLSDGRPFLLEPRISSTYRPHPQLAFKASIGWYSQEISSLSNEREVISIFEPWVITPEYLASPQAANYMAGIEIDVTEHMSLEVETYYKAMTNMVDINEKKFSDRDNDFVNVRGHAYGLEALYKFQPSSFFFQASYSLSWAFKEKYGELRVPRYDARHSLSTLMSYDFGAGWQLSANWMFRTGLPFTPIGGFYDRTSIEPYGSVGYDPIAYWDNAATARLPIYHRLDCSFSKVLKAGSFDVTFGGSILNVYDKKNIFYFNRDSGRSVYMLPFTPSLFVKAEL
ncbi:MAG: TonB-dependent receptor plug domain-containing protein, partial [Acidobacteriota bacterium]